MLMGLALDTKLSPGLWTLATAGNRGGVAISPAPDDE
jgi:hypothetical protein